MATETNRARKLAVILHADVAGSTGLVLRDETLAHERIATTFARFSGVIVSYRGTVLEVRGDALVAELPRPSDAVSAALRFQQENSAHNSTLSDGVVPLVRVGISLGEVVIADGTVTGPGVVLAQRVEQLAQPDGVSVTAAVREAVPIRFPLVYEDLGLQSAKGFGELVHVYAVSLRPDAQVPAPDAPPSPATPRHSRRPWLVGTAIGFVILLAAIAWLRPWAPQYEPARPEKMAFELPDKPSIAILPFDSFSSEPGDQRLADAFTENLTAVIARIPNFQVTARNSAFRFRGGNASVREVAETLAVRYVLEGSVQRSNEQLRVTVQLIDAVAGTHVWAETYDRNMADFFKLSDDVALRVARELSIQLTLGEMGRTNDTENLEAYLRNRAGWAEFNKFSPESNLKARAIAEEALELDKNYPPTRTLVAWTYAVAARLRWSKNVEKSWGVAEQLARRLIDDSPDHQGGYEVLAYVQQFKNHNYAAAEQLYEKALEKNPSYTGNMAMLASATFSQGKWAKTIQLRRKAMRLQPLYPPWYLIVLGYAHVFNGDSEEALKLALGGLRSDSVPSFQRIGLHSVAVQAHAAAGNLAEARKHAEAMLALDPEATVERVVQRYPLQNSAHRALFKERFLAAGLPSGGS